MQKKDLEELNHAQADSGIKHYFKFGAMGRYIMRLFGKKDPNAPINFNLKMMHGINKISIIMFLIALIVMVARWIIRS